MVLANQLELHPIQVVQLGYGPVSQQNENNTHLEKLMAAPAPSKTSQNMALHEPMKRQAITANALNNAGTAARHACTQCERIYR